ncbi:MAG: hypothetical protein HUJ54_08295 [Erysipelotrichaceae bacterium]|nr:hypothetical protein [Erysipelotrichaceae bacterium]
MKKSGIIIICLLLSAGTAACSGPAAANKSSAAEQSSEENGETVTVTLPAFLVQGQKEEDLKAAAQKEGYDSCVLNEDGTVTYVMTAQVNRQMTEKLQKSFVSSVENMMKSKDVPQSYDSVTYNDTGSKIDIQINPSLYKEGDTGYAAGLFIPGLYWQCFNGTDAKSADVLINFINKNTGEMIESSSFKLYLKQLKEAESKQQLD